MFPRQKSAFAIRAPRSRRRAAGGRHRPRRLALEALESRALLAVLNVPASFATIQEAVDNARRGDRIAVADGLYEESVDLSRMGTAIGRGPGNLEIRGASTNVVLRAPAGAALVNSSPFTGNLRFSRMTVESPAAASGSTGVALDDVTGNVEISELVFQNVLGVGLDLSNVNGSLQVTGSTFDGTGGEGAADALFVANLRGTGVVHDNDFLDVLADAIHIQQALDTEAAVMVSENMVRGDASFLATTDDGIVASAAGTARLDLTLDRNVLENLAGRAIDVTVGEMAELQSRWTGNNSQQVQGDAALRLAAGGSSRVAWAAILNSVLDAFNDGIAVTLDESAEVSAVIRDNLLLAVGDGADDEGLVIGSSATATGELAATIDDNTFDTIGGDGLQASLDGSLAATLRITDNFFTGVNVLGGQAALRAENAAASSSSQVLLQVTGNQLLDDPAFADAYLLRQQGGTLALEGTEATADAQLAADNIGAPITIIGTVPVVAPGAVQQARPLLLGDFVWVDENADGLQDAGEPGQAFVLVSLEGTEQSGGAAVSRDTLTDARGGYLFPGLAAGDYGVEFERPIGFQFTLRDQGGDDAVDSDVVPGTRTAAATLVVGTDDRTIDAGLVRIWQNPDNRFDVNNDGEVTPNDVLQVINSINRDGPRMLDPLALSVEQPPPFLDVNGDGFVTALDALGVINEVNRAIQGEGEGGPATGEGRPEGEDALGKSAPVPVLVDLALLDLVDEFLRRGRSRR